MEILFIANNNIKDTTNERKKQGTTGGLIAKQKISPGNITIIL